MIEILLEDLLNKIHTKSFSDPKQVSEELGRLIIKDNLTQEQFAYCSSKIFNSELNLFGFINDNYMEKDKHIVNLRKEILVIISDYLQVAKIYLINYLVFIRDSALSVYRKDTSQVVKEAALKIVVKILQNYDPAIMEPVIQVNNLAQMMLDEIKHLKPTPSIKGKIWQILGELVKRFPAKTKPFLFEIQEVSFYSLKGMMENTQKVEIKTLKGLLQLTRCVLEVGTYPEEETKDLYIYTLVGSQKIDDIATYDIMMECLLILKENWKKFDRFINGNEKNIIENLLSQVKNNNRKVKESASDTLEAFVEMISERETAAHQDLIAHFVSKIKLIIKQNEDPVEVMVCIRCFGYLAKLVKTCFGQEDLQKHFLLLFEISQNKVLDDITDSYKNNEYDDIAPENFKKILFRQKQLNSHIKAFALIIREMDQLSENHAKHLLDLFMIGVKKHKLFFEGYKRYLYMALVQLICSIYKHKDLYKFWIKKGIDEIINSFVELPKDPTVDYDQDVQSVKSSAEFVIRLIKQPDYWVEEVRKDFVNNLLMGFIEFFNSSDFGYEEIVEGGRKIYIPFNNEDQHLTLRLGLVFEEIQRNQVLDDSLLESFSLLLILVSKKIHQFPRTSSLQKVFKSLLSIAERLHQPLLIESPENVEIIESVLESQFSLLKELRNDILFDFLKNILSTPTFILQKNTKLLEIFKRSLVITLEVTGNQNLFMIDHIITALERVLIKGEVEIKTGRDKFLKEILPYFSSLLDMDLTIKTTQVYTMTVQEAVLEKEMVLKKCITFLGSLGSDVHYIAKGQQKENELEKNEGEELKILIPINKYSISLNLHHIIKRSSQLALESSNEDLQSASCELFHASMIVLIGKCSQGNQSSETFVESIEDSIPNILKLAINSNKFSGLFKELLFQISRWLAHNKDEENTLVSSFIGSILSLAGCGDKPEVRSLCLQSLEQFLSYTNKIHLKYDYQIRNYEIFFRKVEALSLHPDSFRRLAGLMSLKLVVGQIITSDNLLYSLFYDTCYYFFLFTRKNERNESGQNNQDSTQYCDEIYQAIQAILLKKSNLFVGHNNESSKFTSINDLYVYLQKNLFSPETSFREYSMKLWLKIRNELPQLVTSEALKHSLNFLDGDFVAQEEDIIYGMKSFIAFCSSFTTLITNKTLMINHLVESKIFKSFIAASGSYLNWQEDDQVTFDSSSTNQMIKTLKNESVLQYIKFVSHIRPEDRDVYLSSIKGEALVQGVLVAAFKSKSSKLIGLCQNFLEILKLDTHRIIRDFVNKHEYRFDSAKDPIYDFKKKIPVKGLETFLSTIISFIPLQDIHGEILNKIRVYHMLKFIKTVNKSTLGDILTRSKVLLQFLLDTKSLEDGQILEFLDPFSLFYDNYSNLVQTHLSRIPEQESSGIIHFMFVHSKKDHNILNSILNLMSLFITGNRTTAIFHKSYTEVFDIAFISTHELLLKNVLNMGIIFLKERHALPYDFCSAIITLATKRDNRAVLGNLALEFMSNFVQANSYEKNLLMYKSVKAGLIEFSRDILPVMLDDQHTSNKEYEPILQFSFRVLDIIRCSLMLEPVELIFPIIRNLRKFKTEINTIVKSMMDSDKFELMLNNWRYCMNIFKDKAISESLEYNIRFMIVERILLPLLEMSKEDHLREFFIECYNDLIEILTKDVSSEVTAVGKVLLCSEKAVAFKLFELFFRKINSNCIKDVIHPRVIGATSQKNEITKKLIVLCGNTKKFKREELFAVIRQELERLEARVDFGLIRSYLLDYYNSTYTCLISVLISTQSKESPFDKFLLTSEVSKRDLVLENLIDLKIQHSFKVSTNFKSESLNDYYKNEVTGSLDSNSRYGVRQFVARLTANSLFTQTIHRGRVAGDAFDESNTQRQQILNMIKDESLPDTGTAQKMDEEEIQRMEELRLEMDPVNQLTAMKPFIRLIDHLQANFGKAEEAGEKMLESLLPWLNLVYNMFLDHTELNYRIFLVKLLINRPDVFKPYREHFSLFLLEFLAQKETGGVGFHYFLRDVCTTLISWNIADDTVILNKGAGLLRKLAFEAMKNLSKKLADESKIVFLTNIDIYQKLCHLLRHSLILDSALVLTMLIYEEAAPAPEKETEAHVHKAKELSNKSILWRLAGISILESSLNEGIELGSFEETKDNTGSGGNVSQRNNLSQEMTMGMGGYSSQNVISSSSMDIESEAKVLVFHEKILLAVLNNMRAKKKALSTAAFRLAGILIGYLSMKLPFSHLPYEQVKSKVLKEIESMVMKDSSNLEENICELCKVIPEIAKESVVMRQLTLYIIKTSGKTRGHVFSCLCTIFVKCLEGGEGFEGVANELTLTIQSSLDKIIRDSDQNNIREFLVLLHEVVKVKNKVTVSFLEICLMRISHIVYKLLKVEDIVHFFDFIVLLYDYYSDNKEILLTCKKYMIVGLSSPNEEVRSLFIDFLNSDSRTAKTEEGMLQFILRDLYNPEFEHHWLTTSAQIIMSLSKFSNQSDAVIFDRPLAGYVSSGLLSLKSHINMANQMSQPLIPFSLVSMTQGGEMMKFNPAAATQQMLEMKEGAIKAKAKYGDSGPDDKMSILSDDNQNFFRDPETATIASKFTVTTVNKALNSKIPGQKPLAESQKNLRSFLRANQVNFNQVSQIEDSKVRIQDNFGVAGKKQTFFNLQLTKPVEMPGIKTIRTYRLGELPDIQIKYSDLLNPLTVLASQDPKIAQEIFVPLFIEVYNKQMMTTNQTNFRHLLNIIDQSHGNYQVINTVQGILYELSMKADDLQIDPSLITKTGTGSLSFGGAALLLEDMMGRIQKKPREQDLEKPSVRIKTNSPAINYKDDEKFSIRVETEEEVKLVLNLIEIYKEMNEDDILRGLYRVLHNQDKTANDVYDLKMGKKTVLSLKKLEEMIGEAKSTHLDIFLNYLSQEKRESLYILNKWEELVQDIRKEPTYQSIFEEKGSPEVFVLKSINKMESNDRHYILRAMLSNDNYWEILRESTEVMMADPIQKNILEKDYPYELSLLSITMLEFDRSKFYLEKFKDKFLKGWAGVRDFSGLKTKIEIVSELLRQQELKDFLYNTKHYHVDGLVGSPDLDRFYDTVNNWTKRKSSGILDNFSYLSDSYNARCLFIDIMKNKYQEYGSDLYNSHHIKISLEYIKGLLKMGYIDTADRIMSKSYGRKEKYLPNDTALDYDFASIFIQSKLDGFERDANFITRVLDESSINIKFINTRFSKINQIMDFWMKKKNNTANVQFEENLNFSLLNLKTKIKEMDAIKDYLGPSCEEEVSNQYLKLLHESMDIAKDKISKLEARENNLLLEVDNTGYKSKILKKASNLTENVLRWYKIKAENNKITLKQYAEQERKIAIIDLAADFIRYTSGLCAQGKIIPSKVLFVLEMTSEFSSKLGTLFWDCFKSVPTWIFLKWLPQIMSFMNFDSGEAFIPLITKMAGKYPEPVFYAMSVTTDFSTIFGKQNKCISMLCDIMDLHFGKEWTHHKFVRSMEWMLHPDQRVKTWMDCIDENVTKKGNLEVIRSRMIKDVFTIEDEVLGDNIGEFNRKFIKDMEKYVKVLFGDDFSKLTTMSQKELLNNTKELFLRADGYCKGKSVAFTTSTYKTKLSNFSGWLNDYDINNYRRQNLRIEIPGQYSGDTEPIPELNIKVSYFLPEILVIQSIRKPKRLTMLGSDEKVYHSLVKGGEDLRLDQRIEQIFGIMNDIFGKDPECSKREFNIGTFNVTPVKKGLGVMEWVKNTIPLKSVMEKEITTKEDLLNNKAYYRRQALLKSLSKSKDIREQHVALLGAPREVIVKDFNNQLGYFRADLLKFAIKKKVSNAEQYVKLRKVFLSNYAVLSLGSYILGVGDRHLDNFLFDFVQGKIIPIDFGYSFGFGIGLYIPEMMPFRMTQNFVELTYPLGLEGIYRNSMIFALKALKDHKHLLVDTCEVFIRDPLLDWIKMARGKVTNGTSQMIEMEANIYPRDKLKVVQMKLNGYNPVTVMLSEMDNTRHKDQAYTAQLFQTVRGASHRPRAALAGGILPLCDQVDALLDMSIDPDILGRAWSGWAPYA